MCILVYDAAKSDFYLFQDGTDLVQHVNNRFKAATNSVQPYMLYLQVAGTFCIVVDCEIICLPPTAGIADAFDVLFKTYFVMNVSYPLSLCFFYNFMETEIYETSPSTAYPSVVSLINTLENHVVRDSDDE